MIAPISIPEKLLKSLNLVTNGENYDIVWPDGTGFSSFMLEINMGKIAKLKATVHNLRKLADRS